MVLRGKSYDNMTPPPLQQALKGLRSMCALQLPWLTTCLPAALPLQVDTLLMKHFLSAFSDEDSVLILKHCKEVLAPGGSILLLQTLVPEAGDRSHNTCQDGVAPGKGGSGGSTNAACITARQVLFWCCPNVHAGVVSLGVGVCGAHCLSGATNICCNAHLC